MFANELENSLLCVFQGGCVVVYGRLPLFFPWLLDAKYVFSVSKGGFIMFHIYPPGTVLTLLSRVAGWAEFSYIHMRLGEALIPVLGHCVVGWWWWIDINDVCKSLCLRAFSVCGGTLWELIRIPLGRWENTESISTEFSLLIFALLCCFWFSPFIGRVLWS